MRYLIPITALLGASPALANPPGVDYCMSRFNTCLANAAGHTQARYCRANMDLCMRKPPAHRTADERGANGWARSTWTTTVKPK